MFILYEGCITPYVNVEIKCYLFLSFEKGRVTIGDQEDNPDIFLNASMHTGNSLYTVNSYVNIDSDLVNCTNI